MKLFATVFTIFLIVQSAAHAQSFSHNYKNFFGKDDRIELYSEKAEKRFTAEILQEIRDNTLLIDCGSQNKPSTAFVAKTKDGIRIVSAAHNLTMAKVKNKTCKLGKIDLPKGQISGNFKDDGTQGDAAYDIAYWPNLTEHKGFGVCDSVNTSAKFALIQSLDGTGKLGISPDCKVKSVKGNLITTTCQGHYKASGAPLLSIEDDKVCVVGVFNAHSGRLFEYESYAARLAP